MRPVILETPFAALAGEDPETSLVENIAYARAMMRKLLLAGAAPYASHLLYTQPGVLDDDVKHERALGIEAGLVLGRAMSATTVVGLDRGLSAGMIHGILRAVDEGREVLVDAIDSPGALLTAPPGKNMTVTTALGPLEIPDAAMAVHRSLDALDVLRGAAVFSRS